MYNVDVNWPQMIQDVSPSCLNDVPPLCEVPPKMYRARITTGGLNLEVKKPCCDFQTGIIKSCWRGKGHVPYTV